MEKPPLTFFDLPPELRNLCYSFALMPVSGAVQPTNERSDAPELALLSSRRQIKYEAGKIYWHNTFLVDLSRETILAGAPEARDWLFAIGDKYIRRLGTIVTRHENRFELTLGHQEVDGKHSLVLKDLWRATDKHWNPFHNARFWQDPSDPLNQERLPQRPLPIPYDDRPVRASISFALREIFSATSLRTGQPPPKREAIGGHLLTEREKIQASTFDLTSWCGPNLIGGLAQFRFRCDNTRNEISIHSTRQRWSSSKAVRRCIKAVCL